MENSIDMNPTGRRPQARRFVLLIGWMCIAVAARAAGVRDLKIPADGRGPEIAVQLWAPCSSPPAPIMVHRGTVRLAIRGVQDCAPAGKRLPLIVISHGMLEDLYSHHDTAEFLADAGFAVVTLSHPQDAVSSSKDTVDNMSSFLVRPIDIQRTITFVLSPSQAAVDIDSRRIGFFGFSRGGYTGLVLAGAVPNFHRLLFPCPEALLMCRQIRDNDVPAEVSRYEPRIKAYVIADPISFFPDKVSLNKVAAPVQLWSSEHGGMGVRPGDVASVRGNLPHAPEFHRPANSVHFSFLFPCSEEEAKVMSFQCTDALGFDRTEFHRRFNAQVLTFFLKNLTGYNGR